MPGVNSKILLLAATMLLSGTTMKRIVVDAFIFYGDPHRARYDAPANESSSFASPVARKSGSRILFFGKLRRTVEKKRMDKAMGSKMSVA
jgi:hypothetical protein